LDVSNPSAERISVASERSPVDPAGDVACRVLYEERVGPRGLAADAFTSDRVVPVPRGSCSSSRSGCSSPRGRVQTFLDATEATAWPGEVIEAAARVPSWVHATRADRIELAPPTEPEFTGEWWVETVRPGPGVARLMLKRVA
jgi:hypothetical protein